MYQRIIVPLDGSKRAEQALPHAASLARAVSAPVLLVQVVGFPYLEGGHVMSWEVYKQTLDHVVNDETAEAEAYLAGICKQLTADGLTASSEVRRGDVDRAILAGTRPGDAIVMATHGRGGLARWFMGSVAEDVVRNATVPVLLVRSAAVPEVESTS